MERDLASELGREAARIEEDALFSYKGHYNAAVPWRRWSRLLASAAALGSSLAAVAVLKEWSVAISVGSAAIATLTSTIYASLQPRSVADGHERAGDRYLAIRNRSRIFRNIQMLVHDATAESLVAEIKALSSSLDQAREGAPVLPRGAYQQAKRDIEVGGFAEYRADKISPPADRS